MKVTHEKLLEYMLKTDFQPILVNFWCGNLGGGGGDVAPLVPSPMLYYATIKVPLCMLQNMLGLP